MPGVGEDLGQMKILARGGGGDTLILLSLVSSFIEN